MTLSAMPPSRGTAGWLISFMYFPPPLVCPTTTNDLMNAMDAPFGLPNNNKTYVFCMGRVALKCTQFKLNYFGFVESASDFEATTIDCASNFFGMVLHASTCCSVISSKKPEPVKTIIFISLSKFLCFSHLIVLARQVKSWVQDNNTYMYIYIIIYIYIYIYCAECQLVRQFMGQLSQVVLKKQPSAFRVLK